MKIVLDNMTIEPQSSTFDYVYGPPERIGELAQIRLHHTGWGVYPSTAEQIKNVILLADKSGRQWLVEVK